VRARYPEVDMNLVKMLPLTPSGHVDIDVHYVACKQAADCIARQIITESDRQRANWDVPAS
jgi:predicted nucleotidyltransferase